MDNNNALTKTIELFTLWLGSSCVNVHNLDHHTYIEEYILFFFGFKKTFNFKEVFKSFFTLFTSRLNALKLKHVNYYYNRSFSSTLIFEGMFLMWGRPKSASRR